MKSALIAACVAAVVSAGSAVAATRLINGHLIQNHTVPATKLTEAAVASLRGPPDHDGTSVRFTLVKGPSITVPPSNTDAGQSSALCPSGSYPVGGGFIVTNGFDANPVVLASTEDTSDGKTVDGWDVEIGNSAEGGATMPLTFHAWATCETGGGPITLPGS